MRPPVIGASGKLLWRLAWLAGFLLAVMGEQPAAGAERSNKVQQLLGHSSDPIQPLKVTSGFLPLVRIEVI